MYSRQRCGILTKYEFIPLSSVTAVQAGLSGQRQCSHWLTERKKGSTVKSGHGQMARGRGERWTLFCPTGKLLYSCCPADVCHSFLLSYLTKIDSKDLLEEVA